MSGAKMWLTIICLCTVTVKRRQKTAPLGAVFGTPSTASTAETVAHVFDIHKQFSRRLLGKNRVESLSHNKLESQFSLLRLRDFGDGIGARREVFIPIIFRTP